MIKDLKKIGLDESEIFGGKAANLGFLIQNNFNVPEGHCISTEHDHSDVEILNRLKILGTVSVRSSANCEDAKNASFAGMFDTFLNISDEKSLIRAINKCKSSVDSDRVGIYLKSKGISNVKMAVIVQKMVDADFAGIMFTKDPIEKKHILIEAAPGLGENIVSGKITPSNFFISGDEIIKKDNSHKIDEKLVLKIAEIGKQIEELYGTPQDIEFAVRGSEIFVLQSRPITT